MFISTLVMSVLRLKYSHSRRREEQEMLEAGEREKVRLEKRAAKEKRREENKHRDEERKREQDAKMRHEMQMQGANGGKANGNTRHQDTNM